MAIGVIAPTCNSVISIMDQRSWPWKKKSSDKASVEKAAVAILDSAAATTDINGSQGDQVSRYAGGRKLPCLSPELQLQSMLAIGRAYKGLGFVIPMADLGFTKTQLIIGLKHFDSLEEISCCHGLFWTKLGGILRIFRCSGYKFDRYPIKKKKT